MLDRDACEHAKRRQGLANLTLERGSKVIVIEDVPAEICEDCGEYFLSSEVAEEIMRRGDFAAESDVPYQVLRFAA